MPTAFKDYYQILGVSPESGDKELKQRFRELAKELHPDANLNLEEGARKQKEEKFKDVGEAYGCLSDSESRKEYDRIREQHEREVREAKTRSETSRTQTARPEGGGGRRSRTSDDWFSNFYEGHSSQFNQPFEDIFRDFWGFENSGKKSTGRMEPDIGLDELFNTFFGYDKRPPTSTSQSPRADQAAERRSYDEKYRKERERLEDKEEKERLEKREAEKNEALNLEIKIPENDRYLVLGMMKMVKNKDLDKIDVKDENGILLWRVERIHRGMVPPGFEVSRGLADVADWDKNIKIKTKEGGQMFPVEVEREIIPGRVFNVIDIDETSKWKGREGLPKGLRKYVPTLGNLAYSLTIMEEGGGKGWIDEKMPQRIENYLNANRELHFGEIKEIKIGEITKGLNENRLTEIPKADEGKINDK